MDVIISALLDRLQAMHQSIERALAGMPDEAMDWSPGPEMNSLGVLVAHTLGAERYWIGDVAGGSPSGRAREAEFLTTGRSAESFISQAHEVLAYSKSVLAQLTPQEMAAIRMVRDSRQETVAWAILHALEHTAIHTGHIEITRQLWDMRQQKRRE